MKAPVSRVQELAKALAHTELMISKAQEKVNVLEEKRAGILLELREAN